MSEDIVAKALKLLEEEGISQKNSGLEVFCDKISGYIKNAYTKYETCKKGKEKEIEEKKQKQEPIKSNTTCSIEENDIFLNTHVEEFKSVDTHDSNRCDYLLYWMSDQINECKNNAYCIIKLHNIFSKFWEDTGCCEKKVDGKNECKNKFIIEFDKKAIMNKKELYQFMKHYNNIENIINEGISENKEIYCKYIMHTFDLYELMDNEDNEHVHKKYEKELKYFQKTFTANDKLSKLKTVCNYPSLSVTSQSERNKLNLSLEANSERLITLKDDLSKNIIQPPNGMDEILKNSPSYMLYKEFDKVGDTREIKEACENHFKDESTYKNEGIEICKKILKNFNMLYNNEIKIKIDNPCLHYKYWVYQEIWKMIRNKKEFNNVKKITEKFLDLQKNKNIPSDPTKIACHYYYIFQDLIELNTKIEEKDLHDYFKYYDNLEKNVLAENNKETYRSYLSYINALYEKHKIGWDCCDTSYGVDPLCRHYFKCEDEYNPSYLISLINGKSKEAHMQRKPKFPVVLIGDEVLPNKLTEDDVMRIQYGRCTYVYDPNNNEKIFGKRCDYVASPKHFENFYNNLPDGKKKVASQPISETESSTVNMSNLSGISNTEENESNPVSYKIPTSVALGLGTVFVFFLYYKFTPLGSFFGKRYLGGRSFEDDFNEEYMQEFSYDSEYEDVNTHNRRIHIAYQRE
ncbi:PIR Superfamily Protein [Plasmodium ovale wallikeri]|uniref:PIR Superfamily Protein n=2 Tax=Plasmodium ovale TaxID=36330 RepID=A0A1A9ANB5_PLAOA|nr:PIR Superfamily Protein [Plasmodium ovale wallikeri]SBT57696.1 PIR Superfamily Protein [Plasmodium ovale wallikeri]SBT73757.1 PIR protein [Plasmodium ovale]